MLRRRRALEARVEELAAAIERMEQLTTTVASELYKVRETNAAALRSLLQDHNGNRARLRELRRDAAYAAVFDDPEPLVSVVIPTFDNTELLLERSLPSVLRQSYERLEVIVVGDGVPPAVGAAVEKQGDDRVRFANLPYRLPHPDPYRQWLAGSVAARTAGLELARGAWIVEFDDDDALRPRAVERTLALARERRLEVAYGPLSYHRPDGSVETMAACPPELGKFATQGALVHCGLRFFERSHAAALFDVPNDWFRIEAMLRAGVRFGMHDEVTLDYFPSMRGDPGARTTPAP